MVCRDIPHPMIVGTEWLIDATHCDPATLRDLPAVRSVLEHVIDVLRLRVVGEGHWHKFGADGGVTGLYLLTESHLACHTYPESGIATFNLYCCRERAPYPWESELGKRLGAKHVQARHHPRGVP